MSDHKRPRDCVRSGHVSETHATVFDTHSCYDCGGDVPCELVPDMCRIGELQVTIRSLRKENQKLRKLVKRWRNDDRDPAPSGRGLI